LTTLKMISPNAENLNFAISTDWLRDLIPAGVGQEVIGQGISDPPKQHHSSNFAWWIVLLSLPIIYLIARRIILRPETMDTLVRERPQADPFRTMSASPKRVTEDWNVTNGQAQLEVGRGVSDAVRRDVGWNRAKVSGEDLDGRKSELEKRVVLNSKTNRPIEALTRTKSDQRIQSASIAETQRTSKLITVTVVLLVVIVLLVVAAAFRLST
jgi:hypothetical protein